MWFLSDFKITKFRYSNRRVKWKSHMFYASLLKYMEKPAAPTEGVVQAIFHQLNLHQSLQSIPRFKQNWTTYTPEKKSWKSANPFKSYWGVKLGRRSNAVYLRAPKAVQRLLVVWWQYVFGKMAASTAVTMQGIGTCSSCHCAAICSLVEDTKVLIFWKFPGMFPKFPLYFVQISSQIQSRVLFCLGVLCV